ncbi:hypothetical protein P3G55_25490, partial [Leptospira sp. 96542]|nr:hypothetical protein [Leptospira sp. 96542]
SGNIVIEVADDGGGLKKERIMAKAVERGLVQPDQSLSDKEIFSSCVSLVRMFWMQAGDSAC